MKELLEKWIYKYTNVFNNELNDKPAGVKPFELHEKPGSTWKKLAANTMKELQDAVANCCKLYLLDEDLPIFLHRRVHVWSRRLPIPTKRRQTNTDTVPQ